MTPSASSGRRVSTPLVLATVSTMFAISLIALWNMADPDAAAEIARPTSVAANRPTLSMDDQSPEAVAESFYDAWRRRAWEQASSVSVGEALGAVREKRERDQSLSGADRAMAEQAWNTLAQAPMDLLLSGSEELGQGAVRLHGRAEYDFVGSPYRREVEFEVVEEDSSFRVRRMVLGRVLTDLPELFTGD